MIMKIYICGLILLILGLITKSSCQIYSNTEKQLLVDERLIDDSPISFGIKSFTIEITKPTTKPSIIFEDNSKRTEFNNNTEHYSIEKGEINKENSFNVNNISSSYDDNRLNEKNDSRTQLINSTKYPYDEELKLLTKVTSIKLENTGERPPSIKSLNETLTNIKNAETLSNFYASKILSSSDELTNGNKRKNDVEENKKDSEKFLETNHKINIIDLYPPEVPPTTNVKIEIDDDKNKLTNTLNELFDVDENVSTSKIDIELIDGDNNKNINKKNFSATDLTGKLQERDGIITEIEKKFRLNDLLQITPIPQIQQIGNKNLELIDRRVKKSFTNFPYTKSYKDTATTERIDIGNTKFNTNVKDQIDKNNDLNNYKGREDLSTTKFYNSKELYNEMLQRKNSKLLLYSQVESNTKANMITSSQSQIFTTNDNNLNSSNTQTDYSPSSSQMTTPITQENNIFIKNTSFSPTSLSSVPTSSSSSSTYKSSPELLGKTDTINTESISNTETILYSSISQDTRITQNSENFVSSSSITTPNFNLLQSGTSSSTIPNFRSHILTRLQQKINALECDIQNVSEGSKIWRGNETHELLLPVTAIENCTQSQNCKTKIKTWEGQTEIQSGDVLLVEINDSLLGQDDHTNIVHKPNTQVYQVTRPGYEHCDVTEGVLLDITPLVVDEKKLVTLYDKDLTEGINLLIVVSELWGNQCVRLKVTVKSDNCGENADCSTKGVCFSNEAMEGYECQCCSGFAGSHCEEIDACSPSPCTNNGICVDLSQGHEGNAYQCLCPYGYTGKNCQYETDPCNPAECLNGATCTGNSTHFGCHCAAGYTGPLCQHNLNECESSPCIHGICVDQENGFRCFCQPGFSGELCNFEYNECESNPCLNEAQCVDQIGGFDCKCTKGYTGSRCQIKVDFCASKPCPEEHRCIDHGNYFSCECPRGRNGPDCDQMPRILCSVNTCANGGTCWSRIDSFYCACRPGYTGKMCEDEFVVETVVSSSEFMVDDSRNFNEKPFGSNPIKSPIELHNAYIAAGTLAAAIFIVAIVVTVCHCKVNQTYRRFSNRQTAFIPIFGFGKRVKSPNSHRHWLSGKRILGNNGSNSQYQNPYTNGNGQLHQQILSHPVHERSFQRQLALNLENDMYYTVDFSESQNSPLMQ